MRGQERFRKHRQRRAARGRLASKPGDFVQTPLAIKPHCGRLHDPALKDPP
jgi:hypothetical protein